MQEVCGSRTPERETRYNHEKIVFFNKTFLVSNFTGLRNNVEYRTIWGYGRDMGRVYAPN